MQWCVTRYSANTAFLALVAADKGLNSVAYRLSIYVSVTKATVRGRRG